MGKKNRVKFWVQSSRMNKPIEEIKLLPAEWGEETLEGEVESWAPEVFPRFHFTEAHVTYGFEILEEVEMTEFQLTLNNAGENVWHDKLVYVSLSAEVTQGGEIGLISEGDILEAKLKKLLDLVPKECCNNIKLLKESLGYTLHGEITVVQAWEIREMLERLY